jgi:mannose-6-phosphate isomerase-like protein (cupin superfamily)
VSGRVIDLAVAASAAHAPNLAPGAADVFLGERLGVRYVRVAPGDRLTVKTAPGEEQVWLALGGSGRYRPDPIAGDDTAGEAFAPGMAAVLRAGEWFELVCDGERPLELVAVVAPQPTARA